MFANNKTKAEAAVVIGVAIFLLSQNAMTGRYPTLMFVTLLVGLVIAAWGAIKWVRIYQGYDPVD